MSSLPPQDPPSGETPPEGAPPSATTPAMASTPPGTASGPSRILGWLRAPFTCWFHAGASGNVALVGLGLILHLLALPPGPLPILILAADAPFFWLLFRQDGRTWKRWAFLYGFLHFAIALRWLSEVHPAQVLAAGFFLGLVSLLLGGALRFLARRRVSFPLAAGTCVVLEELLRTVWMGGMPWPARSLSFAGTAPLDPGLHTLLPAVAYVGAYGLSFLAGAMSAVVYQVPGVLRVPLAERTAAWRGWMLAGLVPMLTLLGLMMLSLERRKEHAARLEDGRCYHSTRSLAAIQGNIPQSLKHSLDNADLLAMFDLHVSLSAQAVRQDGPDALFALLWPETMITYDFLDADLAARFPEDWDNQIGVIKRLRHDVPEAEDLDWLLGAIHQFRRGDERHIRIWRYGSHDSLFHVRPRGAPRMHEPNPRPPPLGGKPAWEPEGTTRHDKVRLVPGGEYTPLGEILVPLRWLRNIVSVIPELDPGADDQAPFRLRDPDRPESAEIRAGTVICFELAFPDRCRAWRRSGAEVLLNAANYGWFGPTGFRDQIQAVARLRAAELGVTVVMAGNTGPTAFFDPLGARYGTFWSPDAAAAPAAAGLPAGTPATTHRVGWAVGRVFADPTPTPYTNLGDWPWMALGVLLLAVACLRGPRTGSPGGVGPG